MASKHSAKRFETKDKQKRKRKINLRSLLMLVFIVVFIFSGVKIIKWIFGNKQNEKVQNNLSQYELLSNKIRDSIVGDGMEDEYPSTLAVVNYVKPKIQGIQDSINRVISNTVKSITNTSTDSQYPTAKAVYSFVTSKIPAIATSIGSSSKNDQTVSPLAVYKYVTSYVTNWAKGSSVSFTKTGSGLTGLSVSCTEYKWGYKIYVKCDKWTPTKTYQKMQVGTFGKSICTHYVHGLESGYLDIKIEGAKLFFHSSSGTTNAKSQIYTYMFIPK